MKCQCRHCVRDREIDRIISARDTDAMIAMIRELQNENCDIGEDLCYHKAILEGSWPSATRQLCEALGRALHQERQVSG